MKIDLFIKTAVVQILLSCFMICQAQNTNIQGVILDEHNKPIENVGIYIMDSTIVALANGDGRFTIPSGNRRLSTLVSSCFMLQSFETSLNTRKIFAEPLLEK